MRRFEELCDLIAIEQDVEKFSALVTELNQLIQPTAYQLFQKSHHHVTLCTIDRSTTPRKSARPRGYWLNINQRLSRAYQD